MHGRDQRDLRHDIGRSEPRRSRVGAVSERCRSRMSNVQMSAIVIERAKYLFVEAGIVHAILGRETRFRHSNALTRPTILRRFRTEKTHGHGKRSCDTKNGGGGGKGAVRWRERRDEAYSRHRDGMESGWTDTTPFTFFHYSR